MVSFISSSFISFVFYTHKYKVIISCDVIETPGVNYMRDIPRHFYLGVETSNVGIN